MGIDSVMHWMTYLPIGRLSIGCSVPKYSAFTKFFDDSPLAQGIWSLWLDTESQWYSLLIVPRGSVSGSVAFGPVSSFSLLVTFYQTHLPCTVPARSLILSISSPFRSLTHGDRKKKVKSLATFFLQKINYNRYLKLLCFSWVTVVNSSLLCYVPSLIIRVFLKSILSRS